MSSKDKPAKIISLKAYRSKKLQATDSTRPIPSIPAAPAEELNTPHYLEITRPLFPFTSIDEDTAISAIETFLAYGEEEPSLRPDLHPAALHGVAGEFVRLATEESEASPVAVLMSFLTYIGVELGKGAHFIVSADMHAPSLFSVIVGMSGAARKGLSMGPALLLHRKLTERGWLTSKHEANASLSSGEGLLEPINDEPGKKKLTEDELLALADKRLFLLDQEFGGSLSASKRGVNTLTATIRKLWDGHDISTLVRNNPLKVTDPHVGIVANITQNELDRRMPSHEVFTGFANRFCWALIYPTRRVPVPKELDGVQFDGIVDYLHSLLTYNQVVGGQLWFDKEAAGYWEMLYERFYENRSSGSAAVDRGDAITLRLALLYALLDGCDHIGLKHLGAAVAVWLYCYESARILFPAEDIGSWGNVIYSLLETKGSLTRTEIHRALNNNGSKHQLDAELSTLIAVGKVLEEKRTGGVGRPAKVYSIVK